MVSDPTSIAAMLAQLGEPQNEPERILIDRMRAWAAVELTVGEGMQRYVEWIKALTTKHAILVYREYQTP